MGNAIKADKQEKTDLAKVNQLVKEIVQLKKREAKSRASRMELLVQVQELADKNRNRWFGDKKSLIVDQGRLVYKLNSKAVSGPGFDFEQFYAAFPHLFKWKPEHNLSASELRTLLADPNIGKQLQMLELDVEGVEKFDVE